MLRHEQHIVDEPPLPVYKVKVKARHLGSGVIGAKDTIIHIRGTLIYILW
jgi:hypothetical protein